MDMKMEMKMEIKNRNDFIFIIMIFLLAVVIVKKHQYEYYWYQTISYERIFFPGQYTVVHCPISKVARYGNTTCAAIQRM